MSVQGLGSCDVKDVSMRPVGEAFDVIGNYRILCRLPEAGAKGRLFVFTKRQFVYTNLRDFPGECHESDRLEAAEWPRRCANRRNLFEGRRRAAEIGRASCRDRVCQYV